MVQVSIIVLTYYPDPQKLLNTLKMAVSQEGVDFEIILSDDGSKENGFSAAEDYFKSINFQNYRLVANSENKGTVQNCISGLNNATGEYVFLTSPGDILFDTQVIRDFYFFAKRQNAKLCFGNAVHYCTADERVVISSPYGSAPKPGDYALGKSLASQRARFAECNWVVGASYFRQREAALHYFNTIAPSCIYMEDAPSTAFALADGIPLCYYDRNMVWYEDGVGVSTGNNKKWKRLLEQDMSNAIQALKRLHPKANWVDVAWSNSCIDNRRKRIAYKALHHPLAFLRHYWRKNLEKKSVVVYTDGDVSRLEKLIFSNKSSI